MSNSTPSTFFRTDLTYHYSKYSCSRDFYFAHIVFCYMIFLSGCGCFITRVFEKTRPYHQYFGRSYEFSMILATGTSLLIHNTGLPGAVLVSFAYTIIGMILAIIVIKVYKYRFQEKVYLKAFNRVSNGTFNKVSTDANKQSLSKDDIHFILSQSAKETINEKNLLQKIISLKSLHGILMFISWINITGRIFASDQSGDFTCYTQPVYKTSFNSNSTEYSPQFVPERDPNFQRLPWSDGLPDTGQFPVSWSIYLFFGPLVFAILFNAIWVIVDRFICKKCQISSKS